MLDAMFPTKRQTVVCRMDGKTLVQKNDSRQNPTAKTSTNPPSVSVGDEMSGKYGNFGNQEGKHLPKHFTEDTLLSAMEAAGAEYLMRWSARFGNACDPVPVSA